MNDTVWVLIGLTFLGLAIAGSLVKGSTSIGTTLGNLFSSSQTVSSQKTVNITLAIIGLALVSWVFFSSTNVEVPSVVQISRDKWFPIILCCILAVIITAINKKEWVKSAWGFVTFALVGVYVVLPIIGWATSPKATSETVPAAEPGCTTKHHCTPALQPDGSTEITKIEEGKSVCFSKSYYANLPRLGLTTSYLGSPMENPTNCTASSRCDRDAFQFHPEPGVPVPEYWFVQFGSSQC